MDYIVTISDGNTEVLSLTVRVFDGYKLKVKCYNTFAMFIADGVNAFVHREIPFGDDKWHNGDKLTVNVSETSTKNNPDLDLSKLKLIPREPRVTEEDLNNMCEFRYHLEKFLED